MVHLRIISRVKRVKFTFAEEFHLSAKWLSFGYSPLLLTVRAHLIGIELELLEFV